MSTPTLALTYQEKEPTVAKDKSKKNKAEEPEVEETVVKKSKKDKGSKAEKPAKTESAADEDDEFDPKGGGDGAQMKDLVGSLLFITPTAVKKDFKTSAGISDAIVADVVVLVEGTKPKKFEVFEDSMIFQSILVSALKDKLKNGGSIAAKLVMGEAKNGKSAPYLFERSDEAKDLARAWLKVSGPDLD